MKMVQKWCENSQECATPSRLISILDKMKLNQVKHWWWSLYFGKFVVTVLEDLKQLIHSF